ncbi:MAG: hypothetical protein R2795_20145 [Saprospiraceae bacterium]
MAGFSGAVATRFYLHQTFRPELSQALPFHQVGYRLLSRYTFRLASDTLHFNRNNQRLLKKPVIFPSPLPMTPIYCGRC